MLAGLLLHRALASNKGSCSRAATLSWYQNTYLCRYVAKLESRNGATRKHFATRIDLGEFHICKIASFFSLGMQLVASSWSFSVVISGFKFSNQCFAVYGRQFAIVSDFAISIYKC